MMDMIFDGRFADRETARNFPVGQPIGNQFENFFFAVGEFWKHGISLLCGNVASMVRGALCDEVEQFTPD